MGLQDPDTVVGHYLPEINTIVAARDRVIVGPSVFLDVEPLPEVVTRPVGWFEGQEELTGRLWDLASSGDSHRVLAVARQIESADVPVVNVLTSPRMPFTDDVIDEIGTRILHSSGMHGELIIKAVLSRCGLEAHKVATAYYQSS